MIVAIVATVLTALGSGAEPPPELQQLRASRSFRTAYVEYTLYDPWLFPGRGPQSFIGTHAYGDALLERLGDDNGIVDPDSIGQPLACSPDRYLWLANSNEFWNSRPDDQHVRVSRLDDPSFAGPRVDVRAFGTTARRTTSNELDALTNVTSKRGADTEYTQYSVAPGDGPIVIVTGYVPQYAVEHKWFIDQSKGFNPIRCELWEKGQLEQYCENQLEEFPGGVWFPARSDYYSGGNLSDSIVIMRTRFNDPRDARPLGPWVFDLPDGALILRPPSADDKGIVQGDGIVYPSCRLNYWGLGRELTSREFGEARREGLVDTSRISALTRALASEDGAGRFPTNYARMVDFGLVKPGEEPGLWEEYTRRFIRAQKLSPQAAQKAWRILDEAQKPAYKYLDEIRPKLAELDAGLKSTEKTSDPDTSAESQRAQGHRADLLRRITQIFEQDLKAKLEVLVESREGSPPR